MITLAFWVTTLFLEYGSPQVEPTKIHLAWSIYTVLYVVYFMYSLVKWSNVVKPDDDTTVDVDVSSGYPRLFAIAVIIDAIIYVVSARTLKTPNVLLIVAILLIIQAIFFIILQASEAKEQHVHFSAIYMLFFCKELSAALIIIGLPFAMVLTIFQIMIMLISLPLHIFKVPIYKLTPKKTFISQLFTL